MGPFTCCCLWLEVDPVMLHSMRPTMAAYPQYFKRPLILSVHAERYGPMKMNIQFGMLSVSTLGKTLRYITCPQVASTRLIIHMAYIAKNAQLYTTSVFSGMW